MTNEELVLAIQAGQNVTENVKQLYIQNRGLVRKAANRFKGYEDLDDLMQEGFLGLVRAVELWNPEQEVVFATYAYFWIKQTMRRYITNHGGLIRIPEHQRARIVQYKRAVNSIRMRFGRDPRPAELVTMLGISFDQLYGLENDVIAADRVRSTSAPVGDDGETILEDLLPDDSEPMADAIDRIQNEELARELWGQVDQLPEVEAGVIRSRYCGDLTLKQCGDALGMTPEKVRSVEAAAMRKLRRPEVVRRLVVYLSDSSAYSIGIKSGYGSFRSSWSSSQERAVILLEKKAGPIWPANEVINESC